MTGVAAKIKSTITSAPLGALGGACIGYLIAKKLNYHKSLPVVSFVVVGLIIGSAIGDKVKTAI